MSWIRAFSSASQTSCLCFHYFSFSASINFYSSASILWVSPLRSLKFSKNYLVSSFYFSNFSLSSLSCILSLSTMALIIILSSAFSFLKSSDLNRFCSVLLCWRALLRSMFRWCCSTYLCLCLASSSFHCWLSMSLSCCFEI